MIKAIKLVLKEPAVVDVYFSDGLVKKYDILNLSNRFPQLNALKDKKLFNQGKLLGTSVIYFNDELDIDVEVIYEDGIDVTNEYKDVCLVVLGYQIKQKRLMLSLSQEELSLLTGINQSDLSKIEKGKMNISIKTLNRIAKALKAKLNIEII